MKKTIVFLFLSLSLLLSCSKPEQIVQNEYIHSIAEGKTDWYDSEKELYNAADVVVKVRKTEHENNVKKSLDESRGYYYGYTLSGVTVITVIKNETNLDIAHNDTLTVLENQFSYVDQNTGNLITYHINQYSMMEPENEYYLYLAYSISDKWFVPLCGFLGKVNVDPNEDLLFPTEDINGSGQEFAAEKSILDTMRIIQEECIKKYE